MEFDESRSASRRSGSRMRCVFLKLAVICALFFLLQNPTDLQKKESQRRLLAQHEADQREENLNGSKELLDKMWRKEINKWKTDMYSINKETFWEFKKICLINNVDFKWENEMWENFRGQMSKNMYEKEQKDYEDFLTLKSKEPTEKEINEFILEKRKTFDIFCEFLKNERASLMDHVIREWMKVRSGILDKMEHKVQKVRKLLKKMKKKEVAKLYS
ncbi:hypothetical protein PVIIG_02673 [Plasmodium vivax India VII]|uniref:Plasmodium RESA N-terminal domain-containing protein n=5 Tax=Plasmodium vivax TaxID=5855 RepID=A5KE89_PLAVS|nr:hypothetical protein, conserved [Plasmodium vivax]EDL42307.1 hypothetical protein, conserved [Plasmodium vivax]KMZ81191.1 hypothetical protein PVIIG_02673 [Plasmodium vivax India VII]KMZ93691.1 hypothetical protein PVMG_05275 [Plasmodium vivax Mauritania I]KNA00290.1 hypothetical protein PVNG_04340 [Plasmodium vivax North Korean]|eukprot:XP_001608331.1 hypothetical protein [Plasmodium vivax Sal-1]